MVRPNRIEQDEEVQPIDTGDDSMYLEENFRDGESVYITEDWDTMMEEFYDDYEDFQDVDFPTLDDDYM
ncbi:MAG: hypothetical protein OEX00_02745 [Gammaproteobacteria bacterium]|nr:hypothetical protein [Gammaproteobacteria bacterium]MDH5693008.1 hypothetical protein [Gammaproteobacteria bacterium]